MPRSSASVHQSELDTLRAVILAIIDFHAAREIEFREGSAPELRELTERAHEKRQRSDLRQIRDDVVSMTEALRLAPTELKRLDVMLRERSGRSLDEVLAPQLARIAKLRERGHLSTEAQYYLVKERIEFIWDDPARADEFRELRALLDAYEESVAKRAGRGQHRDPAA